MTNYNNLKSLGVFIDHNDGSIKSVFKSTNGGVIEMTLINNKSYDVLCVPTHHFCNLGCKMCHLTNNKLNKCMVPIESTEFIEAVLKSVCNQNPEKNYDRRTNKKDLLISFMGVGEPLLNQSLIKQVFENEKVIKYLLHYNNISYAVATMLPSGELFEKFTKMINENNIPLKVHFSLHNPDDNQRFEIIPSSSIKICDALKLLKFYANTLQNNKHIMQNYNLFHRNSIPIEIHYTLIKDVNDGENELSKMLMLLSRYSIPIKFLTFNPKEDMQISDNQSHWISTIKTELPSLVVKTYSPPGKQIGSSCGEFTKHYYHMEIETAEELNEFLTWENQHKINY